MPKEKPSEYFEWFKQNPPGMALIYFPEMERICAAVYYSGMLAGVNFAAGAGIEVEDYDEQVVELMQAIQNAIFDLYGGRPIDGSNN